MSLVVFIYTICILCVCLSAASTSLAAYAVTRRLKYLPQTIFFVAYFIELSGIFAGEWMLQNVGVITYDNYYAIDNPAFRIIVGAVVLACLWLIIFDMVDVKEQRLILVPTLALCAAQALIVALMPYGPLRQWLFYTMRQVSIFACLGYAFHRYRKNADEVFRQRLERRRRFFVVLLALTCCVLAEDVIVILVAPIPAGDGAAGGVFLSSRNISENVMMVVVAGVTFYRTLRELALRFNEPPELSSSSESHNEQLMDHVENRLPAYAEKNRLSKREREILALVLVGKTNREIAEELFLAEGTVKTHLHNIMKKCGQPNREELKKDFWRS